MTFADLANDEVVETRVHVLVDLFEVGIASHEDILRLKISVDDRAVSMKKVERREDLFGDHFDEGHGQTFGLVESHNGEQVAAEDLENHSDV